MDFKTELLSSIQIMINRKLGDYKADRTYKSVIKSISPKEYVRHFIKIFLKRR